MRACEAGRCTHETRTQTKRVFDSFRNECASCAPHENQLNHRSSIAGHDIWTTYAGVREDTGYGVGDTTTAYLYPRNFSTVADSRKLFGTWNNNNNFSKWPSHSNVTWRLHTYDVTGQNFSENWKRYSLRLRVALVNSNAFYSIAYAVLFTPD